MPNSTDMFEYILTTQRDPYTNERIFQTSRGRIFRVDEMLLSSRGNLGPHFSWVGTDVTLLNNFINVTGSDEAPVTSTGGPRSFIGMTTPSYNHDLTNLWRGPSNHSPTGILSIRHNDPYGFVEFQLDNSQYVRVHTSDLVKFITGSISKPNSQASASSSKTDHPPGYDPSLDLTYLVD